MRVMKALAITALLLAVAGPALAQVDIRTAPPATPERPRDLVVTPGPYTDITEPRENSWYPQGVRVPYEPAFIAPPMSEEYETTTSRGRYGIAGWTAPNVPVGAGGLLYNDRPGWFSLGFAFTWGAPPRAVAPARTSPAAPSAPGR